MTDDIAPAIRPSLRARWWAWRLQRRAATQPARRLIGQVATGLLLLIAGALILGLAVGLSAGTQAATVPALP